MITDAQIEARMQKYREAGKAYAEAKAQRVYLENFRKVKRALLMRQAEAEGVTVAAKQLRDAEGHPEYLEVLEGLKIATEQEAAMYHELKATELGISLYQTAERGRRAEKQGYKVG